MKGWNRFIAQWQKDLKLWLFFMAFFLLFRCALVVAFRLQINASSTYQKVAAALLNGMRFDSVIASYLLVFPLLFTIIAGFVGTMRLADKVRVSFGTAGVVLSSMVCVASFSYFQEFGDQFNHFIFGLIYDDRRAVIATIWKEYHVIPIAVAMTVVALAALKIMHRFIRSPFLSPQTVDRLTPTLWHKIVAGLIIAVLFAAGVRGSLGRRPVQPRDVAVTGDEFLDKTVVNPFMALLYAAQQQHEVTNIKGFRVFLPDGDVSSAARTFFSTGAAYDDLDRYMLRSAEGTNRKIPRHIFLIVGEGYSAWPLMKKYEALGLAEGVRRLLQEGLKVENFVPSSGGTMSSLGVIVTGLPDAGVNTNYQKTARVAYPTSIAGIFKRLGYQTRFFYGGYLSWQKVGDFCRSQGFDQIYGGGNIGSWASSNEWGMDDEYLFEFVLNAVDDDRPSFNLILTTSNHPPYDIDVRTKGFKLREIPAELRSALASDINFTELGHYWYADQCIKNFALSVEKKLTLPLVVITGDHAWRKKIIKRPELYEKTAVPLVFYGRDVLAGLALPPEAAGSHLDIDCTLIELAAPPGFAYHALGKNLFAPQQRALGFGGTVVIGADFIIDMEGSRIAYPLSGDKLPRVLPDVQQITKLYNDLHGIAWWRIMRGPKL